LSSSVIEGSYCKVNRKLADDKRLNPHKYQNVFNHAANLKILNYLIDCNRPDEEIIICREYIIDGEKQSIRQFLDAEYYNLLDELIKNQELIKDRITQANPHINGLMGWHAFQGDEK